MPLYKLLPTTLLLAAHNVSAAPGIPDIKAGLWEIGIVMEIPDMPGQTPRIAQQECLTPEKLLPQLQQQTGECAMTGSAIAGNTATWNMRCQVQGGVIIGNGEIRYGPESFEGAVTLQMQDAPGILPMASKLDGHYLGPCGQ